MVSKKNGWEGKIKKKWKEKWSNEQANKKWELAHQQKKEASGSPSTDKIDIFFCKAFFTLPYNESRAIVRIFSSFKLI